MLNVSLFINTIKKELIMLLSFKSYLNEKEQSCPIFSRSDVTKIENFFDRVFAKFGIDLEFSRHFVERLSDTRNNPCISLREFAEMLKKIYEKKKNNKISLKKYKDTEIVIKDIQTDLNMPVAIEYDRKNDELVVIGKTIMRKKNFRTPNEILKV